MSCESEEVLRLRTAEQIRGAMNCCGRMRSRMRRRDNKPVCAAADLGRKTAMKKIAFYDGWSFGQAGEEKRPVTLPHDAMLSGGRDASSPTGSAGAFFQAGVYEYEKTIDIPAEGGPATAILEFEGVMRGAKVYVNDVEAGGAAYGYIPFRVNLGAYVTPGGANVIRVVADNSAQPASRWYAGGGIYRPVWLWSGGKTVIAPDGVRVTTRSIDPPSAEVEVRTLGAQTAQDLTARVEIQICDAAPVCAEISIGADGRAKAVIDLPGAGLWSEETPNLYTCRVVLMDNGRIIDTAETLFGLRQVSWSSEGLFINGKNTLLRGGCVHHDNGLLGAASFDVSEYRRVKKLKEAGYNAIRSSHNPCSRASWAWSGCDGNEAVIEVYSSAPSVEVFLNGESLGKADTAECKASFTAAYAPGALEAVAYDAKGAETGRSRLVSAKGELSVQLAAEKPETAFDDFCSSENEEDIAGETWDCRASDGEIVYVNVAIADADGVVESNADAALTASVTGGELLAFGSANPRTEEDYLSGTFTTYYGRAQAIVRRAAGTKALLTVTGTAADGTEYRSNLNV